MLNNNAEAITSEQWRRLLRLQATGCPVDWDRVPRPLAPVVIVQESGPLNTHVFPCAGGVGILARVRIAARVPMTICGYRLRARWFPGSARWLHECECHHALCFHGTPVGNITVNPRGALHRQVDHAGTLKRGGCFQNNLTATVAGLASPPGDTLPALLEIEDAFGERYGFRLELRSAPLSSDLGCAAGSEPNCGVVQRATDVSIALAPKFRDAECVDLIDWALNETP